MLNPCVFNVFHLVGHLFSTFLLHFEVPFSKGCPWGASWGSFWEPLGLPGALLGPPWGLLGTPWELLGSSLTPLGPPQVLIGRPFGTFGVPFGTQWAPKGGPFRDFKGSQFLHSDIILPCLGDPIWGALQAHREDPILKGVLGLGPDYQKTSIWDRFSGHPGGSAQMVIFIVS